MNGYAPAPTAKLAENHSGSERLNESLPTSAAVSGISLVTFINALLGRLKHCCQITHRNPRIEQQLSKSRFRPG
ncbi:MAG: hypothetical protein Tsb002_22050 [Wenzhouxiangellaceae bacterium]